jgi:hypothetical protein
MSRSDFCRTHFAGGGGMLPCPWPACPHGHDEDVYLDHRVSWAPEKVYKRQSFVAGDGSLRYFWISDDQPYGWVVRQPVQSELFRLSKPNQTTIYHYTSLAGFKGIIESQDFWLTESDFLNDSTEIEHGIDLARQVFQSFCDQNISPIAGILEGLTIKDTNPRPRINIACFSSARDNLSQWRAYSGDSVGVSLGFSQQDFLPQLGYPSECQLVPVLYAEEHKRALWDTFARFFTEAYRKDSVRQISVTQRDGSDRELFPTSGYESSLQGMLYQLAASCKHSAFEDEREIRLFYTEHSEIVAKYGSGPARVRFRPTSCFLAPYTTLSDIREVYKSNRTDRSTRLSLSEVIVGPHPRADLAIASVKKFLQENGYGDIPVCPSSAPYR